MIRRYTHRIFICKRFVYTLVTLVYIWTCSWFANYSREKSSFNLTHNCILDDSILLKSSHQTDPCLMSIFKQKFLHFPPISKPLDNLKKSKTEVIQNIILDAPTTIEKIMWIKNLIINNPSIKANKNPGFFIECGANDGSFLSATLHLENFYNWTGLLIEANPIPFKKLLQLKRNVYAVNTAVCVTEYPDKVIFYTNPLETGLSGLRKRENLGLTTNITVQCIPLYTMLAALGLETVDYLSLDAEGSELDILRTIPFDRVVFKVMTIEHWNVPEGLDGLKEFLEGNGYRFVKVLEDIITRDSLFVHESLYELAMTSVSNV